MHRWSEPNNSQEGNKKTVTSRETQQKATNSWKGTFAGRPHGNVKQTKTQGEEKTIRALETTTPYCRPNNTHHHRQLTKTGRRNLRASQRKDPGIHERFVKAKKWWATANIWKGDKSFGAKKASKRAKTCHCVAFWKTKIDKSQFSFFKMCRKSVKTGSIGR